MRTHDLDIPRIGYVHSWTRTQDEGWVRAALDTYGVPYTYFADQKLKGEANLRAKYDVIIFPHVGGTAQSQVNGMAMTGTAPLPYKKTDKTPNLGFVDQTDDIRGGMGLEGLMNLAKFVQEGGTLITEGSTTTIFPEYAITSGVTVETPAQLFVRGSILRGKWADAKSPLAYGYENADLPVYFNQVPVLNAGGGGIPAGVRRLLRRRRRRPTPASARTSRPTRSRCASRRSSRRTAPRSASRRPDAAAEFRQHGAASSASASTTRGRAWCCRSRRTRTTCCCRARSRTASSSSNRAALARRAARQGPRRDVRDPPVLALADAGHLLPRLQRDHELERPGRGEEHRAADDYRRATAAVTGSRARISAIAASNFARVDARWLLVCSFKHSGFEPHLIARLPAWRRGVAVPAIQRARHALGELRRSRATAARSSDGLAVPAVAGGLGLVGASSKFG